MKAIALSILLAVGAALGGAAIGQTPPSPPTPPPAAEPYGPVYNFGSQRADPGWNPDPPVVAVPTVNMFWKGIEALRADNFGVAEVIFADVLRIDQRNAEANLYIGVARMNLGKWREARKNLEIAARKLPKYPDPKSRLGVTYAKLGDLAGARAQRADLVKMSEACEGCEFLPFITEGIQMIDKALAEGPAASPAAQF